jgi:hypothetical protein
LAPLNSFYLSNNKNLGVGHILNLLYFGNVDQEPYTICCHTKDNYKKEHKEKHSSNYLKNKFSTENTSFGTLEGRLDSVINFQSKKNQHKLCRELTHMSNEYSNQVSSNCLNGFKEQD